MIGQQLVRSWAPIVRQGIQNRGVSVIAGENEFFSQNIFQ